MTYPAYPTDLRRTLTLDRRRIQPATYQDTDPTIAKYLVRRLPGSPMVTWGAMMRFDDAEMQQFDTWFAATIHDGADWFVLDINVEFGLVTHVCHFGAEGLRYSREGGVHLVVGEIVARELVTPAAWDVAAPFIITRGPHWRRWWSILDVAINQDWPEL